MTVTDWQPPDDADAPPPDDIALRRERHHEPEAPQSTGDRMTETPQKDPRACGQQAGGMTELTEEFDAMNDTNGRPSAQPHTDR